MTVKVMGLARETFQPLIFFRPKSLPTKSNSGFSVRRSSGIKKLIEQFAEGRSVLGRFRRRELPHLAYVRTLLSLPQVIGKLVAQP